MDVTATTLNHYSTTTSVLQKEPSLFDESKLVRTNGVEHRLDLHKDYSFDEWKEVQESIIQEFELVFPEDYPEGKKNLLLDAVITKPTTRDNYLNFLHRQEAARGQGNAPSALKDHYAEIQFQQDIQPVELAVYKGNKLVAFLASGFASNSSIHNHLPADWGNFEPKDLKHHFENSLGTSYKVLTREDGVDFNHGQASKVLNR